MLSCGNEEANSSACCNFLPVTFSLFFAQPGSDPMSLLLWPSPSKWEVHQTLVTFTYYTEWKTWKHCSSITSCQINPFDLWQTPNRIVDFSRPSRSSVWFIFAETEDVFSSHVYGLQFCRGGGGWGAGRQVSAFIPRCQRGLKPSDA